MLKFATALPITPAAAILRGFNDMHRNLTAALLAILVAAPVCAAVKRQRESLRNPPKTAQELLATLESQGLTQSVARLRKFIDLL